MNIQVKQRVVGAIVLVALAVIFIPMLLSGRGNVMPGIENSNVPPAPDYRFPPITQAPPAPVVDKVVVPLDAAEPEAPVADSVPQEMAAAAQVEAPAAVSPAPAARVAQASNIPGATEVSGWVVQLGSFSSQKNAMALRDNLRAKAYATFVEAVNSNGKTIYRVRVGPELSKESADTLRQKLAQEVNLQGLVQQYP